jgi:hypothetical protein
LHSRWAFKRVCSSGEDANALITLDSPLSGRTNLLPDGDGLCYMVDLCVRVLSLPTEGQVNNPFLLLEASVYGALELLRWFLISLSVKMVKAMERPA